MNVMLRTRVCAFCHQRFTMAEISHNLRDYQCVCVYCVEKEDEEHYPCTDDAPPFQRRYEDVV